MCDFITLIVPPVDDSAVQAVMARHGRAALPVDNKSVSRALASGERQFLTTVGHCDCGTVLAQQKSPESLEASLAEEVAKLARKGWSKAKIDRAIADRRKAAERPDKEPQDSFPLWTGILEDLITGLKLPHAGLLVHFYAGNVDSETFDVSRRHSEDSFLAGLKTIRRDEVLVFGAR